MALTDLLVAAAGTGTATTLLGALLGRSASRAEIARIEAERDALRGQAAQALADAAGALAEELRAELARLTTELDHARDAAHRAETEAARLRVDLGQARADIAELQRRIDHLTSTP